MRCYFWGMPYKKTRDLPAIKNDLALTIVKIVPDIPIRELVNLVRLLDEAIEARVAKAINNHVNAYHSSEA